MPETLLTAAQAAARLGVSSVTVRVWCKRGLFPNAELKQTAFGSGWLIPESDLDGFEPPKMGRPRKAQDLKVAKKGSNKKGGDR